MGDEEKLVLLNQHLAAKSSSVSISRPISLAGILRQRQLIKAAGHVSAGANAARDELACSGSGG
jgi:hypothetical protein